MTAALKFLILICILVALIVLILKKTPSPEQASTLEVKSIDRSVVIGAWVGGFFDSQTKKLDTNTLKKFEETVGKKMAIANFYAGWENLADPKFLDILDQINQNGWIPMISSNPYFFNKCTEKKKSLYNAIASSDCDEFIKNAANNLKSYKKPILLRFAWEMNLPQMYWGVKNVGSSEADFINAWRHMHDIFKSQNVENVSWVLSFNTSSPSTIPYAKLYPGDDYVDWVAIDGYNWGDTQPWGGWTDFNGVFRASYDELVNISSKRVMISEVNSAQSGGDKALWLTDMLTLQIPDNFTQIKAIVFFNEDKSKTEKANWKLELSPKYINAVKDGFQNPIYKSNLED